VSHYITLTMTYRQYILRRNELIDSFIDLRGRCRCAQKTSCCHGIPQSEVLSVP
jgi:hypothetical protein